MTTPSVFISWSGYSSKTIAEKLSKWLKDIFPWVDFWTSERIEGGLRWSDEVARALEVSDFGILCLVPSNLEMPWILFEAGALSKKLGSARVVPYRVSVPAEDVRGPLSQFQSVSADRNGTCNLVESIYNALPEQKRPKSEVQQTCTQHWPTLQSELEKVQFEEEWSQPFDCITASVLLRRERIGAEIVSDLSHIYVNTQYPIELRVGGFADQVMNNIRDGVRYLYVFNLDPEIVGPRIAHMVFKLCAGEMDMPRALTETEKNLDELQQKLKIHIAEENYGFEYCVLDAGLPSAHCYLRRPSAAKRIEETQWIDWCDGLMARNVVEQVRKLCVDIAEEENRIIRSTTSCNFYGHPKSGQFNKLLRTYFWQLARQKYPSSPNAIYDKCVKTCIGVV